MSEVIQHITLRPCQVSDRLFILELVQEYLWPYISEYEKPSEEIFDRDFDQQRPYIQIASIEHLDIGCVGSILDGTDGHLHKLFVIGNYQRQGIGSFLLSHAEETARLQGAERMIIEVRKNNPAVHFYSKQGYMQLGEKHNKILMQKSLVV